ncbi:ABC transporter substrate-binding protein [Paenibacillus baekrokdamisoli]|uniref:ABC transporter substrate-binding protein n=1 Tax=Paenibacillus baekrokdamisoli TaxID=1712516 RepID=A0A3G9JJ07_9BACL|nr:ABC transporter substrate-binding protein [Paenibacillus baekrokdamisoli]MBB3071949.1 raffinose/stachyose/melibiose transport system substrate-binding protein [Paenibacillus baekrokdamisoli]BBH24068.1 ABC transporter substrate-binding protein [Paenibacillus baekrokdamisoli]
MKRSKVLFLGVCIALVLSLLAACSKDNTKNNASGTSSEPSESQQATGSASQSSKEVKITFFNTSAEINTVFEKLFKVYKQEHPNVTVELIPTPIGGAQIEKFQSLLASGNPATVVNLDAGTIFQYKDKFLDLESEKAKYAKLALPGAIDGALLDGKFIGVPYSAQGYGLLYNKRVVEEAIGGAFNPSTIKTRSDLESLFKKIEAAGKAPVIIHGADWSLAAHYLGLAYSLQSNDVEKNRQFVEGLKNGTVDLSTNQAYNGLMDTFDLLKKYNARKNDPLVADYNKDSLDFAKGEAAFYFMGDWSWSVIGPLKSRDKDFGILPVPISDNPADFGNSQVAYTEPKLFAIDNAGSTPEQQEAAKTFIEWMITSEASQKAIIGESGLAMPYKNLKVESSNPMSSAISNYVADGKTINIGVINYLPSDYWAKTGASMQKYLVNKIDRAGLTKEVQDYWKSTAGK